jgi:uncharacterized protein YdeI (YjbR/CyaY-like superfamily)
MVEFWANPRGLGNRVGKISSYVSCVIISRPMKATFFSSGADFRRWLEVHSARSTELWVGYFKAGSGKASVTWPESVDHALCYGWIDGIRKSIDEARYVIRFTPRKPISI